MGQIVEEPASGPAAGGPARRSIWPAMHPRLLELVETAPLDAHLRQRPPPRRAPRDPPQRVRARGRVAGRRAVRARRRPRGTELVKAHHGSLSRERRLQIEDELKSGRLKGLVATSSLELGIDMGAVDLVVQVESPRSVAAGMQRIGRAGHQVGEPSRGKLFPKHRADLVEAAVVVQRMHEGPHRAHPLPPQPARRAGAADRRDVRHGGLGRRRARRARAPGGELHRAVRRRVRLGARPARRSLPVRRVRRAAPAHRVGPGQRRRPRPGRRPAAGRHERRHHPRPGAVRRVPPRRHARGRARRGDGLREPPGRDVPARRQHVAHRGHHLRARDRHAGAGPARQDAVLARRRPGSPARAGPGGRRVRPGDASPRPGRSRAPPGRHRPRRAGRRQPRDVPRRAGGGHGRGPRRPHDRRRAVPGRDRRLASVRALALRRQGARAVGDRPAGSARRTVGARRRADVERRRHRPPPPRGDRRAADRRAADRSRRDRRHPHRPAARHRPVRVPVPRVRGPRPAPAPAPPGQAHPAVAATPEGGRPAWRSPAATRRSRSSSRRPASA